MNANFSVGSFCITTFGNDKRDAIVFGFNFIA